MVQYNFSVDLSKTLLLTCPVVPFLHLLFHPYNIILHNITYEKFLSSIIKKSLTLVIAAAFEISAEGLREIHQHWNREFFFKLESVQELEVVDPFLWPIWGLLLKFALRQFHLPMGGNKNAIIGRLFDAGKGSPRAGSNNIRDGLLYFTLRQSEEMDGSDT